LFFGRIGFVTSCSCNQVSATVSWHLTHVIAPTVYARCTGGTVEDELAALKRGQLSARSSAPAQQPQQQSLGRPISEVLVGTREAVKQLEGIDAELEQLRKRARGF
jgi:hypothetical protein